MAIQAPAKMAITGTCRNAATAIPSTTSEVPLNKPARKKWQRKRKKAKRLLKIIPTVSKSTSKVTSLNDSCGGSSEQLNSCVMDSASEALPADFVRDLTYADMEELTKDWLMGEESEDLYDYSDGECSSRDFLGEQLYHTTYVLNQHHLASVVSK